LVSFTFKAYKVGLYGPKIVWLFNGFYGKGFWRLNKDLDCTEEEMDTVVEGIFFLKYTDINLSGERGIANVTRMMSIQFFRTFPSYSRLDILTVYFIK